MSLGESGGVVKLSAPRGSVKSTGMCPGPLSSVIWARAEVLREERKGGWRCYEHVHRRIYMRMQPVKPCRSRVSVFFEF